MTFPINLWRWNAAFRQFGPLNGSSAILEAIACDQFAGMPAVVKSNFERFFGDATRASESSASTKAKTEIRTVANRSVAKTLQSSAFQCAVEIAVYKRLDESHVASDEENHMIDRSVFTFQWPDS